MTTEEEGNQCENGGRVVMEKTFTCIRVCERIEERGSRNGKRMRVVERSDSNDECEGREGGR